MFVGRRVQQVDLDDRSLAQPERKRGLRPLCDDRAAIDDRHARGHARGLVHVVRGEDDRFVGGHPLDVVAHQHPGLGVEPSLGLVEEEDGRIVDQRQRQVEPALHAARQLARLNGGLLRELQVVEESVRAPERLAARYPVEGADEHELLAAGQQLPDDDRLRADAEMARLEAPGCQGASCD